MSSGKVYIFVISLLLLNTQINGSWSSVFSYFWPNRNVRLFGTDVHNLPAVPFEIGERDDKFISDTSKILGKKLSELDLCQQRVILLLKNRCNSLNDDQLSKLSLMLLNCQLATEGRRIFACNDNMLTKDCIADMDRETQELFHVTQNRAKTLCLVIRQDQFRGIAEITVNNLIDSVHENINLMTDLKKIQHDMQQVTLNTMDENAANNLKLLEQQQDLLKITETHKSRAEFNFRDILRENDAIKSGHAQVAESLATLKNQLHESLNNLQVEGEQARYAYNTLINEIDNLQGFAEKISAHLIESDRLIQEQRQQIHDQFKETISHSKYVNEIVLNLSEVIRVFLDEYHVKMKWLSQKLGGSEENLVKNVSTFSIHLGFLLIGMLCMVFVNARLSSRILFLLSVSLNMLAVLYDFIPLSLATLTETICVVLASKCIFKLSQKYDLKKYFEFNSKISKNRTLENSVSNNNNNESSTRIMQSETIPAGTISRFDCATNNQVASNGLENGRSRHSIDRRPMRPASSTRLSNDEDRFTESTRRLSPLADINVI